MHRPARGVQWEAAGRMLRAALLSGPRGRTIGHSANPGQEQLGFWRRAHSHASFWEVCNNLQTYFSTWRLISPLDRGERKVPESLRVLDSQVSSPGILSYMVVCFLAICIFPNISSNVTFCTPPHFKEWGICCPCHYCHKQILGWVIVCHLWWRHQYPVCVTDLPQEHLGTDLGNHCLADLRYHPSVLPSFVHRHSNAR